MGPGAPGAGRGRHNGAVDHLTRCRADGGSAHPIHLIYGVNTDTDLVEVDRLEAFARQLPGFSFALVVVSADSVQIYRGFDLGSGKPTPLERAAAPHHLVDAIDPARMLIG